MVKFILQGMRVSPYFHPMKLKAYPVGRFTALQTMRLGLAVELANKVLASEEFIKTIEKLDPFTYFSGTKDSPLYVSKLLSEEKECGVNVAVWYVPWYKRYTSAIAYESNGRTNLRSTYLENGKISDICATLVHEFLHSVGYSHDFWATKQRPFSVPYAIGNLVSKFAETL